MTDHQGDTFVEALIARVEEAEAAHRSMYLLAQDLSAKADAAIGPVIARMERAEAEVALLRGALEEEPSYSEVLTAAGEAVPMSGDVREDAQRMEAFVLGATWEYNRARAALNPIPVEEAK